MKVFLRKVRHLKLLLKLLSKKMKYRKIVLFSSPSLQWLHPILSANCRYNLRLFRLFSGNNSGNIGINLHRQHVFHIVMLWKRTQVPVAWEISGRGRRRSRDEKGNQGVGDFRFINIWQLFPFLFFFFNYFIVSFFFFAILFLLTTFTHTHTHDPRPLPTTHDPRHLAILLKSHTLGVLSHLTIRNGPNFLEKEHSSETFSCCDKCSTICVDFVIWTNRAWKSGRLRSVSPVPVTLKLSNNS